MEDRKGGFPHSEITGSKGASASPTLIAACHVLHRLSTPRHPSEALMRLIVLSKTHAWGRFALPAVRKAEAAPTHALCALMSSQVSPPSFRGSRTNPSIHNVIRRPGRNLTGNLVSLRSLSRFWWSQTGSNRRPHACKARALPAELWPLISKPQAPAATSVALAGAPRGATPCFTRKNGGLADAARPNGATH